MYVVSDNNTAVPIKIWLPQDAPPETSCMEQAYRLASLPFLHKWVALMPDTHAGIGMPIGGVVASEEVVIPNAVGVDIGCGMGYCSTNIRAEVLMAAKTPCGSIIQGIVEDIMRDVPLGFNHHKNAQPSHTLDRAMEELYLYAQDAALVAEIEAGYYQMGTLGGGNHFIELQEDDDGRLGIMLHSGSRHFGSEVCDYFNRKAKALNERWRSAVPAEYRLAFLPLDTAEGRQYLRWMNLAMDFAYENRSRMLVAVKEIIEKWVRTYTGLSVEFSGEINCHHNYAALEEHYGKTVLVHRKGATRAEAGERALIPGAMGACSYIVEGLGNDLSFRSSSHGAGRRYSRKGAMKTFTPDEVIDDLRKRGVVLGKHNRKDVAEESRFAYKDIDFVMENQRDLVSPVKRLRTVGVVKG